MSNNSCSQLRNSFLLEPLINETSKNKLKDSLKITTYIYSFHVKTFKSFTIRVKSSDSLFYSILFYYGQLIRLKNEIIIF